MVKRMGRAASVHGLLAVACCLLIFVGCDSASPGPTLTPASSPSAAPGINSPVPQTAVPSPPVAETPVSQGTAIAGTGSATDTPEGEMVEVGTPTPVPSPEGMKKGERVQ